MKNLFVLTTLLFVLVWDINAQNLTIEVASDQTTYLIFDFSIASVDRGSNLLMSEQDPVAKNMLKLKALDGSLDRTNLHVLTDDGTLHDFQVRFAQFPTQMTYDLREEVETIEFNRLSQSAVFEYGMSKPDFLKLAEELRRTRSPKLKKTSAYGMSMVLTGIYQANELLFFQIWLENKSELPFLIKGLRLTVLDQKTSLTSSYNVDTLISIFSELEDEEVYLHGEGHYFLLAVPALAIANHKKLEFRLSELKGDRELHFRIKGKELLNAKKLPSFHINTTSYGSREL